MVVHDQLSKKRWEAQQISRCDSCSVSSETLLDDVIGRLAVPIGCVLARSVRLYVDWGGCVVTLVRCSGNSGLVGGVLQLRHVSIADVPEASWEVQFARLAFLITCLAREV